MKQKLFYCLVAVTMLCALAACSNDNEAGKLSVPKGQPDNITLAANETDGHITLISDVSIFASVSDTKDGFSNNNIGWIEVNDPFKDDGKWYINYHLQRNTTGSSRTAYIIVVAQDEKMCFTITQTDKDNPNIDMPDDEVIGNVIISCETFNDYKMTGSYESDGVSNYELQFAGGFPFKMTSAWIDDLDGQPDTKCETEETTEFKHTQNGIYATVTNRLVYRPSGREETEIKSKHLMNLFGPNESASDGSYEWADEEGVTRWNATYDGAGHIIQMNNDDGGSLNGVLIYLFTWKDGLLTKIEEANTGNIVTFSYANSALKNLFKTFDLNWVLAKELETLDFAAGDVDKIWASLGYLGVSSTLLATEISEYRKEDNLTYTYRMNYEHYDSGKIKVNVAHLVNGKQDSYAVWNFKFTNIK